MARGLAQTQQRFEHHDLALSESDLFVPGKEGLAIMIAQFVVKFPLVGVEIAIDRLLQFLWKFAGHLVLGAAENKWAQGVSEHLSGVGVETSRRAGRREGAAGSQHPGIQKLEQAPQFAEMILHGRAAEREPMLSLQKPDRFSRFTRAVFDGLGFVENQVIKFVILEEHRVIAAGAVGGDDEIVVAEIVGGFFAQRASMIENADSRRKSRRLRLPVEHKRPRDDNQ